MFKNNCEVGQKFNFSSLIILQFFLSYVGLWPYRGHTEYSLHFSKEKYKYISGYRRGVEDCSCHSVIQRAEKKSNSNIPRKKRKKKIVKYGSFLSQIHCRST